MVPGNFRADFVDDGIEQTHDVEVIGDESGLREEFFSELFKGIAHVEDDIAHELAARDVSKIYGQPSGGFSKSHFEHFFIWVVDEDGGELAVSKASSEGVLIDTYGFWPGVIFPFSEP